MKQRILFLSWKDITHPSAGGAELLTDVLAEHLAQSHDVTYFTSWYPGAKPQETIHGYTVIRRGTVYTVYLHAFFWWHWEKIYTKKYTHIIDQVHGIPFFSLLYYRRPPIYTLVMEVAGSLWNTTYKAFVAFFGKQLENAWLLSYKTKQVITISESTKNELVSKGFSTKNISILPMFTNIHHAEIPKKADQPTILFIGRIAPVKQVKDTIEAYVIAQKSIPELRLVIIGKTEQAYGKYATSSMEKTAQYPNIFYKPNATEQEKKFWLEQSHLLIISSKKEGYGLVILEAAACGTPAIGYRVPGIQDAIIDQKTGILTSKNSPQELAKSVCEILTNNARYSDMQTQAFAHAKSYTRENTGRAFEHFIRI